MVRSGKFLWNAGMFVMTTRTLDAELTAHCPRLATALRKIAAAPAAASRRPIAGSSIDSFDREIVEKSHKVLGVRARFRWHDVGSWDGLWEAMRSRNGAAHSDNVLSGNVIALGADGVLARAHGRLMVLVGVERPGGG